MEASLGMQSGNGLNTLTTMVRWWVLALLTRKYMIPMSTRRRAGSYGSLETSLRVELGNSTPVSPPEEDAKMPAYGMEGGGSVGAKCLAVMVRTG